MSSDLDVPLLPSAEQIRKRGFVTVRKGGFDQDQVREFLGRVADQVEVLEKESRELRMATGSRQGQGQLQSRAAAPAEAGDPYEAISKRFASMLENADREATAAVAEAKIEAARILEQARAEADRINLDAQARAEQARQQAGESLAQAHEEAQRILGGLSERRESMMTQMNEMRARLLNVADNLDVSLGDPVVAEFEAPPTEPEPPMGAAADAVRAEPDERRAEHEEPSAPASSTSADTTDEAGPTTPPEAGAASTGDDDLIDPRYEDLWASTDTAVELPDLASLDVNFDDEPGTG
jgi:DivIVA domain-containing protein